MDDESSNNDSGKLHREIKGIEDDPSEPSEDAFVEGHDRKYTGPKRRFHLLYLLSLNWCSRQDILERLRDDYNVTEDEASRVSASSQRAGRMLKRDIEYLEEMGFTLERAGRGDTASYHVKQGSGPSSPFLFNQSELDVLVLLHTLFADPTKYAQPDPMLPFPMQPARNPFAEDILALIERLAATLTPQQRKEFDRWTPKPYVYLNLDTITDYLPHRATIDKIIQAIELGRQISFDYVALHRWQGSKRHEQVDPYYITREDGHLYLIGFSHDPYNSYMNRFFEFRIDRIKDESIDLRNEPISMERRRKPIEFCYWIDSSLAERGLSNRWLAQEVVDKKVFTESGKEVKRSLVRALAYSEFRIMQQLHKYGDKVELVEPAALREKMGKEIERLYHRYYKK